MLQHITTYILLLFSFYTLIAGYLLVKAVQVYQNGLTRELEQSMRQIAENNV